MKKIVLKKASSVQPSSKGYKIDYKSELNEGQYNAVMHNGGAALVIAGAGTGKTRTLTYRVARLIEDGVRPEAILLLTFTRKAAYEMLRRSASVLDGRCQKVSGGTFHSFALDELRRYSSVLGFDKNFSVIDQPDTEDLINMMRSNIKLDKTGKRFPQKNTINTIFSMASNKRVPIEEIVKDLYPHFLHDTDNLNILSKEFTAYKLKHNLMTYDDLLEYLLKLLKEHENARKEINDRFKYIMVDEYQDTNRLQHEISLLAAGSHSNIMAVGDDAQSVYSFRGAEYQNIMFFPNSFENCSVYKIEENFRSTAPILNLANDIINNAEFKYEKQLFTQRTDGELPKLITASNERMQSEYIAQTVLEAIEEGISLSSMAVLCRSGWHSFDLEVELNKANIPFAKFGGMKFAEAAHVKDLLAYMRVVNNPRDAVSWQRILLLLEGIGNTTATNIIDGIMVSGADLDNTAFISKIKRGGSQANDLIRLINDMGAPKYSVPQIAEAFMNYYLPFLKKKYEDWQRRKPEIETFVAIASKYNTLASFLNDMAVDPPSDSLAGMEPESKEDSFITISTIHSAKGLEWKKVFIIWALEGRFPSARSIGSIDSIEEERRLFYVAVTRAKDDLDIIYPANIFDRESGFVLSRPSRFIENIGEDLLDKYVISHEE